MRQKFDVLDESLKHLWLESRIVGERSKEEDDLQRILSENYKARMTTSQSEKMHARLLRKRSLSFGALLQTGLKGITYDLSALATRTGLLPSQLEELVQDNIPVNSIPVVFLKNLLAMLNIPFNLASEAILKTFDTIRERENQFQVESVFSPSFKRNQRENHSPMSASMMEGSNELYNNEEAMQQYLEHLKELM